MTVECLCQLETVRRPWHHHPDCLRWAPPPNGPGHTTAARRAAIEATAAAIAEARARRTTPEDQM